MGRNVERTDNDGFPKKLLHKPITFCSEETLNKKV